AKDISKQIEALRKLYFDRYRAAWHAFLSDLVVERPEDSTTALEELNALSEPEWPYLRLIRILHENVALPLEDENKIIATIAEKAEEKLKEKVLGEEPKAKPVAKSPVEKAFGPLTAFAIVEGDQESSSTSLAQYQAILAKLVGLMSDLRDGDTPTSTA